jgi:microsomal dipeptidase-like Zn-dependent dipeptidase
MVGVNFATSFLRQDGRHDGDTPIELVLDHVEYILKRVGDDGVGFGSDFDEIGLGYWKRHGEGTIKEGERGFCLRLSGRDNFCLLNCRAARTEMNLANSCKEFLGVARNNSA